MPQSSGHDSLAEALLAVQRDAPDLQKNAINPHFKNKYISLDSLMEQILPLLNSNDIVLLQFPSTVGPGEPALKTKLLHAPTGDSLEDTMPLVLDRDNPQGQGSAITYARRYSLMSILGLVADEDDDAEQASTTTRRKAEPAASEPVAAGSEW